MKYRDHQLALSRRKVGIGRTGRNDEKGQMQEREAQRGCEWEKTVAELRKPIRATQPDNELHWYPGRSLGFLI
ncbi:MAG: hypothetical protein GXO71_01400 [Caldiserica bacterium]|nr:hypothetical protein [Caldisericota bacterium]